MDTLPQWCSHGTAWHDCKYAECREIWNLAKEQLKEIKREIALGKLAKSAAEQQEEEKGDLKERKTADEIKQEKKLVQDWEDEEKGRTIGGYRSGLPFDHHTVRAMHQYGALSDRQAQIAHLLLDLPHGGQKQKDREQIGRALGYSSKTVKREMERIDTRLFEKRRGYYPPGAIVVINTRGRKAPRYWLTHEIKFRNWRFSWRELLNDRALIRRLRIDRPVIHWRQTPYRQSPMNGLFGALIRELGQEFKAPSNQLPHGAEWPPLEFAKDWEFNVQKAKELLSKRYPGGSWTASQIYHAFGRRAVLCGGCRTPVLRGFRIGGRLITRRAKYCDAACKMKMRRSPSTG